MKASDSFTNTIKSHLDQVALQDALFAESYKKPAKNIKDCITYILNTVKASGVMGFDDSEIFGMAMHYYDEDDIKVGASINGKVVVNHSIPATSKKAAEVKDPKVKSIKKETKKEIDKPIIPLKKEVRKSEKKLVPENQTALF